MMFILCLIMLFIVGAHMLHFIKFSIYMAIYFLSSYSYPEISVIQKVHFSGLIHQRKMRKGDILETLQIR